MVSLNYPLSPIASSSKPKSSIVGFKRPASAIESQCEIPEVKRAIATFGRKFDQQKANLVVQQAETARQHLQLLQTRLAASFAELDSMQLCKYQSGRVRVLYEEATALRSMATSPVQENVHDFMRLVRSYIRKSNWIEQILVELESIVNVEARVYSVA